MVAQVVSTGLKIFEKNSNNSGGSLYRLVQEAAHVVEPFMDGSRRVAFTGADLACLVARDMDRGGTVGTDGVLEPATAVAVKALKPGAFLAILEGSGPPEQGASSSLSSAGAAAEASEKLMVVCWRGRSDTNFNVMCSKESLYVIGHRLVSRGVKVDFSNYAKSGKKEDQAATSSEDSAAAHAPAPPAPESEAPTAPPSED